MAKNTIPGKWMKELIEIKDRIRNVDTQDEYELYELTTDVRNLSDKSEYLARLLKTDLDYLRLELLGHGKMILKDTFDMADLLMGKE